MRLKHQQAGQPAHPVYVIKSCPACAHPSSKLASKLSFAVQQQGDRAVVHQLYLHNGLEDSLLHRQTPLAQELNELFVERAGLFGPRGAIEAGAPSLAAIVVEGELRDGQNRSPGLSRERFILLSSKTRISILELPDKSNIGSTPSGVNRPDADFCA